MDEEFKEIRKKKGGRHLPNILYCHYDISNNCSHILSMYWVGQKVRSDFSVLSYGKTPRNFLANPILRAKHKAKYFTCITSFNIHSNVIK